MGPKQRAMRLLVLGGGILVATASTAALAQCEQAKLTASDAAEEDVFGRSVAISGDYLVVGAPSRAGLEPSGRGAAYVFRREASTWVEQGKLTAGDPQAGALFGSSVSISGDVVVVGAMWAEEPGTSSQGQRTLNPLRRKDLHQELVAPAGDLALPFDAVL